jgi:arylsulfatase A-like enzyme
MISYFEGRTVEEKHKPFFAYLPFSSPHWPLQAPKSCVDKYRGAYDKGPGTLRLQRLDKLKEMGLAANDVVPHDVVVGPGEKDWDDLHPDEQAKSSRAMEVYAGMVDRMDENIGRVLDHLKSTGEYDNTMILFMSDNGAEGASYEAAPVFGDEVMKHIAKYYNNSLENIGRKDSFVWYGSRWAQAATAPSRLFKMYSTEGGCRVPLICKPPIATPASSVTNGFNKQISEAFCSVLDIVPTILDLSETKHPASWHGREVSQLTGRSWRSMLQQLETLSDDLSAAGYECNGSGGLRKGKYKITYVPAPRGPERWELFDIISDAGETRDLSEELPEVFADMLKEWESYARRVGVVGLAGDLKKKIGYKPPVDEFEDVGKWTRWIGREDVPAAIRPFVPI